MNAITCIIDDKHIPLYRIIWVADVPHFCGDPDCVREGQYEIRLEREESVWGNRKERDSALEMIEAWRGGASQSGDEDWQ